jgi:hypothetical protein
MIDFTKLLDAVDAAVDAERARRKEARKHKPACTCSPHYFNADGTRKYDTHSYSCQLSRRNKEAVLHLRVPKMHDWANARLGHRVRLAPGALAKVVDSQGTHLVLEIKCSAVRRFVKRCDLLASIEPVTP